MRLLATTTILWAAGTALAHRDRENGKSTRERHKENDNFPVEGINVYRPANSAVSCTYGNIADGAPLIFDLSKGPIVEFTCTWKDRIINVENAKIRKYVAPMATVLAASLSTSSPTPVPTAPAGQVPGGGDALSAINSFTNGFHNPSGSTPSSPSPVVNAGGSTVTKSPVPGILTGRQAPQPSITVRPTDSNSNSNSGRDFSIFVSDASRLASRDSAMYLEIIWRALDGSTTTSYSYLFGVVSSEPDRQLLLRAGTGIPSPSSSNPGSTLRSDQPGVVDDASQPNPTNINNTGDLKSDGTGGTGSGNSPNGQPIVPSQDPSLGSPTPESQAAPGGLPTGTIAGIAVGAVVGGLLLIGALVFFLLRRRRRQQGDHVSNARPYARDQHTATADLMGEKEAAAGGMGETPHSPYSDDGHGSLPRGLAAPGAAAGMAGAGAAGAHHGSPSAPAPADMHRSSFTPYSDDGTAVPPVDRATGARSETPGGGRYEHLMEQGMSAEDRARVEEEERQLDAEIERARK